MIIAQPEASTQKAQRNYGVKLALAFMAIYLVWRSTYLAIRYSVETIPPLLTAGIRFSVAGVILFIWAWARGVRLKREYWIAGVILGALYFLVSHGMINWAEQTVASELAALLNATQPMFILLLGWLAGRQRITRLSALAKAASAGGCTDVHSDSASLWRCDAVRRGKCRGRVSESAVVEHLPTLNVGTRISDCLWLGGGIHSVHVAAATLLADAGGYTHLCQSRSCSPSGMAICCRTPQRAPSVGLSGDTRSHRADSARRTDGGGKPYSPASLSVARQRP